jgi:hypothetical protein
VVTSVLEEPATSIFRVQVKARMWMPRLDIKGEGSGPWRAGELANHSDGWGKVPSRPMGTMNSRGPSRTQYKLSPSKNFNSQQKFTFISTGISLPFTFLQCACACVNIHTSFSYKSLFTHINTMKEETTEIFSKGYLR